MPAFKRMWRGAVRAGLLLAILTSFAVLAVPLHATAATPANCADVKAANVAAADGTYQIVLDGAALTVYCADMSSTPQEYISLVMTAAGENFSQYTAGGAGAGSNVRTSYTKLRINPTPLSTSPLIVAVDIADQTFSASTGSLNQGRTHVGSMPYAVAMACTAPNDANGIANLDLRGTPFTVVNTFRLGGFRAAGAATVVSPQVVNLTGGGFCGWDAPAPEFNPFNNAGGYDLQLEVDKDVAVTTPPNITTTATGVGGAVVTYTAPATTDADDTTTPAVACLPASGTMFAVGTTTVTCTATDPDDVGTVVTFTVTVMAASTQSTPVPPTGSAPSALLPVVVLGAGVLLIVVAPAVAGRTRRRRLRRS